MHGDVKKPSSGTAVLMEFKAPPRVLRRFPDILCPQKVLEMHPETAPCVPRKEPDERKP